MQQTLTDLTPVLRIGEEFTVGGLRVAQILGRAQRVPRFLSLPMAAEDVVIREQKEPTVPTVEVLNQARAPVLIREGEILEGGRQTRTAEKSVLVPEDTVLEIPVACVERGRWHGERDFLAQGRIAPPEIKSALKAFSLRWREERTHLLPHGEDLQSAVWARVHRLLTSEGVRSPTENVLDYEERREMPSIPCAREQTGLLAVWKDGFLLEYLARPRVYRSLHEQLLKSLPQPPSEPPRGNLVKLLLRILEAPFRKEPGIGMGWNLYAESKDFLATGLTWKGHLLYLSAQPPK